MRAILAVADDAITAMRRTAWIARHHDEMRERYFDHDVARSAMASERCRSWFPPRV